jgi:chloramphenicol-sensitive protein RarD
VNGKSTQSAPATVVAQSAETRRDSQTGLIYGLASYVCWGFIPLYFHAVAEVPPIIVLCHRIFWSVLFLVVVISIRRDWGVVWPVLKNRRTMLLLSAGSALIAVNWLVFIYAVSSRQLLQASLGYFINPLLSIVLGMVFLRERLRGWQWLAVGLVGIAVLNLAFRTGGFPWIALSLAGSFGCYGLVRKKIQIDSLRSLFVETIILLLPALAVLASPNGHRVSAATLGLLSLSGIITAVPLIFFGAALQRLSLSTMGFLQYAGPTLQFLVAIVAFHEALDPARLVSFILCWLAIGVYATDSVITRLPQPIADEPE